MLRLRNSKHQSGGLISLALLLLRPKVRQRSILKCVDSAMRFGRALVLRPADSLGLYTVVATDFQLAADERVITSGSQIL